MKYIKRLALTLVWILIWQVIALVVNNPIILAGPIEVAVTLASDALTAEFWSSIGFSLVRITVGFLAAFIMGISIGVWAGHNKALAEFLEPAVQFMKSVPIVCFIVILLIWFGSSYVSAIAVFLVAFPALYAAVLEALRVRDQKMMQLLKVFRVSVWRRTFAFSWPSFLPFLLSASRIAVGMSWKAGVAAELIGLPLGSIGENIYQAKLTFSSAELFSWTIVVVVISLICEKVFLMVLRRSERWAWQAAMPSFERQREQKQREPGRGSKNVPKSQKEGEGIDHRLSNSSGEKVSAPSAVSPNDAGVVPECSALGRPDEPSCLKQITVSFAQQTVLKELTVQLEPGKRYALRGVSGSGKTTLLLVLEGLIVPESGAVEVNGKVAAVFQEARLFEKRSAIENVQFFVGHCVSRIQISLMLQELLPLESLHKPVSELSGGMRRRVELVRALLSPTQLVLLDEPFAGLDDKSKAQAQKFLDRELKGRTLVVSTHDEQDELDLCLEVLQLQSLMRC